MDKFKEFVAKVTATWAAIGSTLITLAATGFLSIPQPLLDLFSSGVAEGLDIALQAIVVAVGAAINFYQIVRVIFAAKEEAPVEGAKTKIRVLSAEAKKSYAINPFKLVV